MARPEDALRELARLLREEATPISPYVRPPEGEPALGALAAAGPRARGAPGEYALIVEAVREGYELHYGEPRLVAGADPDLALLAGDFLYALGLERLAALGDSEAVRELADLISLCAQLNASAAPEHDTLSSERTGAAWLAAVVAVAAGGGEEHERAKGALRSGGRAAAAELARVAARTASVMGITDALERAAQAIDFASDGRNLS